MTHDGSESGRNVTWRTAGGDNSRRGLGRLACRMQERPARRLPADGIVQASTVFDDAGTAFVADMSGTVQAFSPGGDLLWRKKLSGGMSATPVVHPDEPALFAGTHEGAVYRLDARTGEVKWRKYLRSRTDPRILSDLLFLENANIIILSSWGARFVALEATSGEEKSSWDAGLHARSAAAGDSQGNIYTLRAVRQKGVEVVCVSMTGKESVLLTEAEDDRGANRTLVAAAPVLDETRGVAYIVLNRKDGAHLVAWSLGAAKESWRARLPSQVEATPTVLQNGTIVLADLSGVVRALSPDGKPVFTYETESEYLLAGGVALPDGTFFIGDPLGNVHQVDAKGDGRFLYETSRSIQARPSLSPRGELFVPASDKFVHVFNPEV